MKKRRYQLGKRADQQNETRQRIVEAAAELHREIGPARTTISAVAERAGVQRLTVYRHFPDETALFAACSAYTAALHPPPDPASWSAIDDPSARLQAALRSLYAYYRAMGEGLTRVLRDAEHLPALREALAPMRGYLDAVVEGLAGGWRVEVGAERLFRAALGHALDFWTWRSLDHLGLDGEEAIRLMVRLVSSAAQAKDAPRR